MTNALAHCPRIRVMHCRPDTSQSTVDSLQPTVEFFGISGEMLGIIGNDFSILGMAPIPSTLSTVDWRLATPTEPSRVPIFYGGPPC